MARFFFTPGFRVKIKKQIPIKHENRTHMMNYQKFHKIKGECIANSIYYLDLLNSVEHGRYKPICGILVVEPKVIAHVWLEDARTNQTIGHVAASRHPLNSQARSITSYGLSPVG